MASLLFGASVLAATAAADASQTHTPRQHSSPGTPTQATLSPAAAATGNQEGFSVAISGNTAVVGAPGQADNAGTASVWEHRGAQPWQQDASLPDPRGASNDNYGWAVAISSTKTATYVAIGGDEQNGKPNIVYVYEGSGKTWHLQATLYDPDGRSTDMFGAAMAISSTVLAVGAPGVNSNSGTVYIYKRSGTVWSLQASETDPGDASNDEFGRSVSTSGDEVIASAVDIAYVFTNASGEWTQTAVLPNPGSAKDNFGYAVNLDATTAVIGAPGGVPGTRIGSPLSAGAAYVFARKGSTWSTSKKLLAPAGTKGDEFGYSVTETSGRLVIGMPLYGQVNCGTAFAFSPASSTWLFQGQVLNPSCTQGDKFGFSSSLSGATGVIGAPDANSGAGAVFFLPQPPTSPETTLQDPGSSGVRAVAFNPGASTLATGDLNGSTYLWQGGKTVATLHNPNGQGVFGVAFSSDGKTLAVGTANTTSTTGNIYLWNVSTGKVATTLQDPDGHGVDAIAYSPNGNILATAGHDDGHIYLWNASTHKLMATLTDPDSKGVNSLAFTGDSKFLGAADGNGNAYVWDISTRKIAATLTDPASKGVNGFTFAPNTNSASADGNGHIYMWEAPGTQIGTLSDPSNQSVNSLAFSPDGTSLAATTLGETPSESSIYVWNVATGSLIATFRDPDTEGALQLTFSSTGHTLAVGDANGRTYLWNMTWLGS